MPNGQVKNHSSRDLWVVETDTGRAVAHRLPPGKQSPSSVDADGFKSIDGTTINGHDSWVKLVNFSTADVANRGNELTRGCFLCSNVGEGEFGNIIYDQSGGWGESIGGYLNNELTTLGGGQEFGHGLVIKPCGKQILSLGSMEMELTSDLQSILQSGDSERIKELSGKVESLMRQLLALPESQAIVESELVEEDPEDSFNEIIYPSSDDVATFSHTAGSRRFSHKMRFARIPTGRTRIKWRGIHTRIESQKKSFYLYSNKGAINTDMWESLLAFVACVATLGLLALTLVTGGVFTIPAFIAVIGACGSFVVADRFGSDKAMIRVASHW